MDALAAYGSSSDSEDEAEACGVLCRDGAGSGGGGGEDGRKAPGDADAAAFVPAPNRARACSSPGQNQQQQQQHAGDQDRQQPPQRIRTFPHAEGVYATVIYIKCAFYCVVWSCMLPMYRHQPLSPPSSKPPTSAPSSKPPTSAVPQHKAVHDLLQQLLDSLPSGGDLPRFYPVDSIMKRTAAPPAPPLPATAAQQQQQPPAKDPPPPIPPHISLSRTVATPIDRSKALLASLSRQLQGARPGALRLQGVEALANDERTRTFAALSVQRGADKVCELIATVDAAFAEQGLPQYHRAPRLHASFAWALGDHAAAMQAALSAAPPAHAPLNVPVAQVVCRMGKKEHVVWSAPV